jgi:hypothetical protein
MAIVDHHRLNGFSPDCRMPSASGFFLGTDRRRRRVCGIDAARFDMDVTQISIAAILTSGMRPIRPLPRFGKCVSNA